MGTSENVTAQTADALETALANAAVYRLGACSVGAQGAMGASWPNALRCGRAQSTRCAPEEQPPLASPLAQRQSPTDRLYVLRPQLQQVGHLLWCPLRAAMGLSEWENVLRLC